MTYRPDHHPPDDQPHRPYRTQQPGWQPQPTWQPPRRPEHDDSRNSWPPHHDEGTSGGPGLRPPPGRSREPGYQPPSFDEPTPPRGLLRQPGPGAGFDAGQPAPVRGNLFAEPSARFAQPHVPPPPVAQPHVPPPSEPFRRRQPSDPASAPPAAGPGESDASFISVARVVGTVGTLVAIMVLVFFLVQALQVVAGG